MNPNYLYMLEAAKRPFPEKLEPLVRELEESARKKKSADSRAYESDRMSDAQSPYGRAAPGRSESNARELTQAEKMKPTFHVPIISWASAGKASNYSDLEGYIEERINSDCRDPNAFGLIIEGDSMEPKFYAGDRVIFSPNSEARNGDCVVARLREDGGVVFKQYFRGGKNGAVIRLVSLNPNYDPVEHPASAFRFIYPAVERLTILRR
jgi:SOS-response transcriptional repressor LexA